MVPIRRLSTPLVLATVLAAPFAAPLAAQAPTDGIVLFTIAGPFAPTSSLLVDANGGGTSDLFLGFTPLSFTPPTAVGTDPSNASSLWFLNDEGTPDAGIQRSQVSLLATSPGSPSGFAWTQTGGTRLRVGQSRVFTLRSGGVVEATAKAGGAPFVVLTQPDAIDLAVLGNLVYVACRDAANPSTPAPLFEYNLLTGQLRVVGSYADVRRVAVRRTPGRVAIGTGSGNVREIDTTNGAVVASLAAPGPIEALAYTAGGAIVYAVANASGFEVFSSALPAPLYVGSGILLDLDVAVARAATVTPYGTGCAAGATVSFDALSAPTLGNASFALAAVAAPANLPVVWFFGASRTQSATFGPLPASLGALAAGCDLLVDPIVPLAVFADATGRASLPLPIPVAPVLAGAEWTGQAFVLDPSVGPLGFAGSRGVALRLEP